MSTFSVRESTSLTFRGPSPPCFTNPMREEGGGERGSEPGENNGLWGREARGRKFQNGTNSNSTWDGKEKGTMESSGKCGVCRTKSLSLEVCLSRKERSTSESAARLLAAAPFESVAVVLRHPAENEDLSCSSLGRLVLRFVLLMTSWGRVRYAGVIWKKFLLKENDDYDGEKERHQSKSRERTSRSLKERLSEREGRKEGEEY